MADSAAAAAGEGDGLDALLRVVSARPCSRGDVVQEVTALLRPAKRWDAEALARYLRCTHNLFAAADSLLRAILLRTLRHGLVRPEHVHELLPPRSQWQLLLVVSLEADSESVWERMQALKVVRRMLQLSAADMPMTLIRSVTATAMQRNDSFRRVCLETLREFALVIPAQVAQAGGFRVLFNAALDSSVDDLAEPILLTLIYLLNDASTRRHVRSFVEMQILLSPFTDLDTPENKLKDQRQAARRAFIIFMRSWTGIILLASNPKGLRALTSLLTDSAVSTSVKTVLLEAVAETFAPISGGADTLSSGADGDRRHSSRGRGGGGSGAAQFSYRGRNGSGRGRGKTGGSNAAAAAAAAVALGEDPDAVDASMPGFLNNPAGAAGNAGENRADGSDGLGEGRGDGALVDPVFNMLDCYAGMLCCAYLDTGLFECLCHLATTAQDSIITDRARTLLVTFLIIIARLFPQEVCSQLLSVPALVTVASSTSASDTMTDRALNASNVLLSLATTFSVSRPLGEAAPGGRAEWLRVSDIAEELLHTSHSRLFWSTQTQSTQADMMYELKLAMDSGIDKASFDIQMRRSGVVDTKTCFTWDWNLMSDMLEYSLRQPARLADGLRNKWVKRVSGFYRCSTDEKGYFAHLPWDPHNLHYLENACTLYNVLVEHEEGRQFLQQDRRGQVFSKIVTQLETLVECSVPGPLIMGSDPSDSSAAGSTECAAVRRAVHSDAFVFNQFSCTRTMAREFFTVLGRLTNSSAGREQLNATPLFQHLSVMGHRQELDYLSRLALTSLGFTDAGFISRNLLQIWTTSGGSSKDLRLFAHTLLRALLRCHVDEFEKWGLDVMVTQLQFADLPSSSLLNALEEASQDLVYLRALILKRPEILNRPGVENLLVRFMALPEGLEYLQQINWFDSALNRWQDSRMVQYVERLERALAKALNHSRMMALQKQAQSLRPVPVWCHSHSTTQVHTKKWTPYPDGGVDLEGLLRVPWNVEVTVSEGPEPVGISLALDAFLDASELRSSTSSDVSSDLDRVVKVRALVLNLEGFPKGAEVTADKVLHASLFMGHCPVSKKGRVFSAASADPGRRGHINVAGVANRRGSMNMDGGRGSMTMMGGGEEEKRNGSLGTGGGAGAGGADDVRSHTEYSVCRPLHRKNNREDLGNGTFAVKVSGEPVRWIFAHSATPQKHTPPRSDDTCYLIAVEYLLRLQTNEPMFVPMPRHFMGELARTEQGCRILRELGVIERLCTLLRTEPQRQAQPAAAMVGTEDPSKRLRLTDAAVAAAAEERAEARASNGAAAGGGGTHRTPPSRRGRSETKGGDDAEDDAETWTPVARRAVAWAVGHVGSSDTGVRALFQHDPRIVHFLVDSATRSPNLSFRGTCFAVLGLISRTALGKQLLDMCGWDSSPEFYHALAIPRNWRTLLQPFPDDEFTTSSALQVPNYVPPEPENGPSTDGSASASAGNERSPRGSRSEAGVEIDGTLSADERTVVRLIAKLPGYVMHEDSIGQLARMKREQPRLFQSRALYVHVHRMLEAYSFKLPTRREIHRLFSVRALQTREPPA